MTVTIDVLLYGYVTPYGFQLVCHLASHMPNTAYSVHRDEWVDDCNRPEASRVPRWSMPNTEQPHMDNTAHLLTPGQDSLRVPSAHVPWDRGTPRAAVSTSPVSLNSRGLLTVSLKCNPFEQYNELIHF